MFEDIKEINRRLFNDIWNLSDTSPNSIKGLSPKLIIPKKRDESNRISEQEARFLFTSLLNSFNYYYSVETPTEEGYCQTGTKPISAASDLSLYKNVYENGNSILKKILNIEFKAHNPPPKDIKKDIEKLLREDVPGCWNHLLKNADSGTISTLFRKFEKSISDVIKETTGVINKKILFSICIIEKKLAIQKLLIIPENNIIGNFFKFGYSIKNGKIEIKPKKENGWLVCEKI
jgi:hypothetical protein